MQGTFAYNHFLINFIEQKIIDWWNLTLEIGPFEIWSVKRDIEIWPSKYETWSNFERKSSIILTNFVNAGMFTSFINL